MWQCQTRRGRGNFKNAGRKPTTAEGNVITCAICVSSNQYAKICQEIPENSGQEPRKEKQPKNYENDEEVHLTFASLPGELSENCLCKAILDTGCTTSVAGEEWFLDYLKKLTALERNSTRKQASRVNIMFGGGTKVTTLYCLDIPAFIGSFSFWIRTQRMKDFCCCSLRFAQ